MKISKWIYIETEGLVLFLRELQTTRCLKDDKVCNYLKTIKKFQSMLPQKAKGDILKISLIALKMPTQIFQCLSII